MSLDVDEVFFEVNVTTNYIEHTFTSGSFSMLLRNFTDFSPSGLIRTFRIGSHYFFKQFLAQVTLKWISTLWCQKVYRTVKRTFHLKLFRVILFHSSISKSFIIAVCWYCLLPTMLQLYKRGFSGILRRISLFTLYGRWVATEEVFKKIARRTHKTKCWFYSTG